MKSASLQKQELKTVDFGGVDFKKKCIQNAGGENFLR